MTQTKKSILTQSQAPITFIKETQINELQSYITRALTSQELFQKHFRVSCEQYITTGNINSKLKQVELAINELLNPLSIQITLVKPLTAAKRYMSKLSEVFPKDKYVSYAELFEQIMPQLISEHSDKLIHVIIIRQVRYLEHKTNLKFVNIDKKNVWHVMNSIFFTLNGKIIKNQNELELEFTDITNNEILDVKYKTDQYPCINVNIDCNGSVYAKNSIGNQLKMTAYQELHGLSNKLLYFKGIFGRDKDLQNIDIFNQFVVPWNNNANELDNMKQPTSTCYIQSSFSILLFIAEIMYNNKKFILTEFGGIMYYYNIWNGSNNNKQMINKAENKFKLWLEKQFGSLIPSAFPKPRIALRVNVHKKLLFNCGIEIAARTSGWRSTGRKSIPSNKKNKNKKKRKFAERSKKSVTDITDSPFTCINV
eukprot:317150_1